MPVEAAKFEDLNRNLGNTLCLKIKRHSIYSCYNLVRCYPILPILGRNISQEIWNKRKCTGKHTSCRYVRIVPCKI